MSTSVTVEDGIIKQVFFRDGCDGNLQAVAKLCVGRPIDEVIGMLEGITCGGKRTSCPDQLAQTLRELQQQEQARGQS